ncbi:SCO6745 family protein [Luteipulveratus flavus]|uniref:MarR family transcriptional regulator n=1 Tax=Luteipulveratus flavus TaxID=3031728 RepID=A0ABT6C1Z8_9MICO|nr:hypothetical protein [Luteipulveratus sp. YIM 133296]MDF8262675.1 hypothetical protein [Luteipulveratus sp. YIM 133296]
MSHTTSATTARRLFEVVEPVGVITYMAQEPNDAVRALGLRGVWDAYFAGRAAPLGTTIPAEAVHAMFYNFAPGEVARHIPSVWERVTPEQAITARERGSVAALRRVLGDRASTPEIARAAELALRAGRGARSEGRPMYAALLPLPVPTEPLNRLWHAATLLREHRGDGHVAALMACGIGGTECHVLLALSEGMPAEKFGRVSHLPQAQLGAVIDGMRARGLIDETGWLSDAGRETKARVEALTDELAAPAYDVLSADEVEQLIADLEPLAAVLNAAA